MKICVFLKLCPSICFIEEHRLVTSLYYDIIHILFNLFKMFIEYLNLYHTFCFTRHRNTYSLCD